MKNIFKIHPFFYIFGFICIVTGHFKIFIYIMTIIFIHELGHIIMALKYHWQIDKIIILPLGELTLFNEKINRPLKEEFLITIMGPLVQTILFLIPDSSFRIYNLGILIFNLLPILPLDGSKIINILFNKILSFKQSHILSIFLSMFLIIILFIFKYNLVLYITLFILFLKTIDEYKKHRYMFNKFLFERYLYNYNFKKEKIIKKKEQMKRDYKHIFKNNKYLTEKEFLRKLFDK